MAKRYIYSERRVRTYDKGPSKVREGDGLGGDPRNWTKDQKRKNVIGEEDLTGLTMFHNINGRTSFIVMPGQGTTAHHEPEYHELRDSGLLDDVDIAAVETTIVGHKLLHDVHLECGGKTVESGELWTLRQIDNRMTPKDREKFERMKSDPEVRRQIRVFIQRRQELFGLE